MLGCDQLLILILSEYAIRVAVRMIMERKPDEIPFLVLLCQIVKLLCEEPFISSAAASATAIYRFIFPSVCEVKRSLISLLHHQPLGIDSVRRHQL